jgi:hypothetical protein
MWRNPRCNRFLIWALVLAVLTVRASDTHLHLCFDGQEPPTTVHFADASIHHDNHHDDHHDGEETHADKDLDPFFGVLAKSGDSDLEVALPVSFVVAFLLPVESQTLPVAAETIPLAASPPFYLRPPLRGPPA